MRENKRPWWAFALQMPLLDTVVREEHSEDQKRFFIEGKPVLRSLHWVTHAPALAVLSMVVLGYMAWSMDIKAQPGATKILFIFLLVLVPIIIWLVSGFVVGKIIGRYLARHAEQNAQRLEITIDQAQSILTFADGETIAIDQIRDFKLISDSGLRYDPESKTASLFNLVMETGRGQFQLLPKELGNTSLKLQLISRLKAETRI